MSAPESSNSKAPPSLLSDKAKGADGNGSRILANLEGRVAPTDKPRRSKTPLALVALLVIAAGGWGAWHVQQRAPNESLAATVPASAANIAGTAEPASVASAVVQVAANAGAAAPASSQAATIIADDSDSKAAAPSVSASAGAGESRLSRALADGAEPSNASAPLAAAASLAAASGASVASAATVAQAAKHDKNSPAAVASKGKHETAARSKKESATASASSHHSSAPATIAQSKKAKPGATSKDDSDADLLAALVARTKPADAKTGGSNPATKVTAAVSGNAKLAERVKECGQRGFFEEQLCRWRECDGHWGKDPACPGSTPQARQP
ncbi:hypothetical protein [Paraburkholderia rhynchosiae]|uniref:Uncharacterized protein n=1 Tax=Paraburkholderia rhynchosiae TaxID=487049 RepID=A0A2N7WJQ3_9BURK|nr:hypothetical protein [Paraburkholderia rhynchosiae]PMS29505.1 hypothetical protein C0Z16_18210 [Paraburkholderia rhynchosiae]CAB3706099.1 hypothetical protein LMG27174_03951 [Paraburkholderia rhynchosiae]